jgi:hypothetical protein
VTLYALPVSHLAKRLPKRQRTANYLKPRQPSDLGVQALCRIRRRLNNLAKRMNKYLPEVPFFIVLCHIRGPIRYFTSSAVRHPLVHRLRTIGTTIRLVKQRTDAYRRQNSVQIEDREHTLCL